MKRSWLIGAALVFSLTAVGCKDDDEDETPDSGQTDGGADAGKIDAGVDGGMDAGKTDSGAADAGDAGDAGDAAR